MIIEGLGEGYTSDCERRLCKGTADNADIQKQSELPRCESSSKQFSFVSWLLVPSALSASPSAQPARSAFEVGRHDQLSTAGHGEVINRPSDRDEPQPCQTLPRMRDNLIEHDVQRRDEEHDRDEGMT